MKKNYSVTGEQRKVLVGRIEEITEEKKEYLGVPTMAYRVGIFTISRTGEVSCEDGKGTELEDLAKALAEAGFTPEGEGPDGHPEKGENQTEETQEGPDSLSINVHDDLSDSQFENLKNLMDSKATLMKHAFQSDGITVEREGGNITFSGFTALDGNHANAYLVFITKMVELAKEAHRITGIDKETDNEKFAFRGFLVRLGLVGNEYKQARKILLENLSGNSAFKTEEQRIAFSERQKQLREAKKAAQDAKADEISG